MIGMIIVEFGIYSINGEILIVGLGVDIVLGVGNISIGYIYDLGVINL